MAADGARPCGARPVWGSPEAAHGPKRRQLGQFVSPAGKLRHLFVKLTRPAADARSGLSCKGLFIVTGQAGAGRVGRPVLASRQGG